MIELKCNRCGENCGLNARVIDVRVVHNPNPVNFGDIGEIRLTDDNTHIRYMLCQSCYDELGFPNPYRTGEKLADEIRKSGTARLEIHGKWIYQEPDDKYSWKPWLCSNCKMPGGKNQTEYCSHCGAKIDGENNG